MPFFIKSFLWLNKFFPQIPHPFNEPAQDGVQMLNYADYELETAEEVFKKHGTVFPFFEWIENKIICDFACGGGGKSVYLAEIGAKEVIGVDKNEIFIKQAEKIAGGRGVSSKCRFLCERVTNTSLPTDYFDGIILNDAIDHIDDPKKALLEAKRILKPGGRIFINFESYYYFLGHHLFDAISIPWLHLFTTEKFRIKLYKEAVKKFPDKAERIKLRISKDEKGIEHISYLNHLSLRKFKKLLGELKHEGLHQENLHIFMPQKLIMRIFSRLPIIREMFISTILAVLVKEDVSEERKHGGILKPSSTEIGQKNLTHKPQATIIKFS